MGHWQAVPFTAAHYVGVAPMTWTVTADNVKTNRYALVGKTLFWQLAIEGSALGGTASTGVTVLLPAGVVTAAQGATIGREQNAGWRVDAVMWAAAATAIQVYRLDFANYVVPESIFYFYVNVAIEVQ